MKLSLIPRVRVNYTLADLLSALFVSEKGFCARKQCIKILSDVFDGEKVCLVPSARDAIYELLIRLPQTKVIVPAYTCIAVVEAVTLAKKEIVFSRNTTGFNSDYLDDICESCIVIATHQYGLACNIDEVAKKCKEKGAILIEDCATSLGTTVSGKKTGTFGDFSVVSFNASKTLTVPPFGGLLVGKKAFLIEEIERTAEWVEPNLSFKMKGLFRGLVFCLVKNSYLYRVFHFITISSRGKLQRSEHEAPSPRKTQLYNFKFSEWQASILLKQLNKLEDIFAVRRNIYSYYDKEIKNRLLTKPPYDENSVCTRYAVLVNNRTNFYYHCLKGGVDLDFSHCHLGCPDSYVEECKIASQIVNLPFYYYLTEKEMKEVVKVVNAIE